MLNPWASHTNRMATSGGPPVFKAPLELRYGTSTSFPQHGRLPRRRTPEVQDPERGRQPSRRPPHPPLRRRRSSGICQRKPLLKKLDRARWSWGVKSRRLWRTVTVPEAELTSTPAPCASGLEAVSARDFEERNFLVYSIGKGRLFF